MVVTEVRGDFAGELRKAGSKLVVVDFYATWCGPCKMMQPILEQMSTKYSDVVFLKLDVDQNKEASTQEGVTSIPTFKLFINSSPVATITGADEAGLENAINKYKVKCQTVFTGKTYTMATETDANMTQEDVRLKRLSKLNSTQHPKTVKFKTYLGEQ